MIKLMRSILSALCALCGLGLTLWCGPIALFRLSTLRCSPSGHGGRVLVLGDVHLLGQRKRLWIERMWNDWQLWLSFQSIIAVHRPELIISMGDQLDEGTAVTSDSLHKDYAHRFQRLLNPRDLPIMYLIGNHDAAFGAHMTPELIRRHETAFGPSNRLIEIKGKLYLQLNTMALDNDVQDSYVVQEAMAFLDHVERQRNQTKFPPLILLTHVPLYRQDDVKCGPLRAHETGHITYEAPDFQYSEHHHVLSKTLSDRLLRTIRPHAIFSAHTHAVCSYDHSVSYQKTPIVEYTVPTFAWSMRPDPWYAVVTDHIDICALPTESQHIVSLVMLAVFYIAGISMWWCRHRGSGDKTKVP
ncbi:Metallophosphoesterase 1 [Aphanomyces cochlioides]|nr:Metallophosphoesterase 1 [Aphanomyces cochlioides]